MLKNSVKTWRMSERLTKSGLAKEIRVCASYVTRLENNDIQPSGEVMFRIAAHFNCQIEDIFKPETVKIKR